MVPTTVLRPVELHQRLGAPEGGALFVPSETHVAEWLRGQGPLHVWPPSSAGTLGAEPLETLDRVHGLKGHLWLDLRQGWPPGLWELVEASVSWTSLKLILRGDEGAGEGQTARLGPTLSPNVMLLRQEEPCLVVGDPDWIRGLGPGVVGQVQFHAGQGALLALDVDGVLIDCGRSFHEAVARALADVLPDLAWDDAHFDGFKRLGGFNNDFRLAAAAWALGERGQMGRLWTNRGEGFSDVEARIQELEPRIQVNVQRHYGLTRTLERPTVTLDTLRQVPAGLAILTGRPPDELELAFQVLGFRIPAVCDQAPFLRKPEPAGLLQLADAFQARAIMFVGDTRDDALCLRRARALRPELSWSFLGVGPDRGRFLESGDFEGATLVESLPRLREWVQGADNP